MRKATEASLPRSPLARFARMVAYEFDQLFPFPRDRLWKLLNDHLDDQLITNLHPLVKESRTVSREGHTTVFDRKIDARGKILTSQWRVTAKPPDSFRWEIVTSEDPYASGGLDGGPIRRKSREAPGSAPGGDLKITVLPFFIPQGPIIRRVFDDIDAEDQAYLRG